MQLYSLTKEKVDEPVALRDAKRQELDALIEKTAINLWEEDLSAFEKQYYKVYPDSKKLKKTKSPKSKKTTKNKVIKVLKGSNKTNVKPVLKKKLKKIKIKKKIVISPTNKE